MVSEKETICPNCYHYVCIFFAQNGSTISIIFTTTNKNLDLFGSLEISTIGQF